MKKFTLLFVLLFQLGFSQKNTQNDGVFSVKSSLRINGIIPINLGNNYLNKANKANFGYGLNWSILNYKGFKTGIGYEYIHYSVTDISKAGNINSSRYSDFYGFLSYDYFLNDHFSFTPFIGSGSATIHFSSNPKIITNQNGTMFKIGVQSDYRLNDTFSCFMGISYTHSKFTVNTTPELISFYDNSKTIQLCIGLKID